VGAALVVLVFGAGRLIQPAPAAVAPPCDADLADAEAVIRRQSSTSPNLVFLRDKGVLFNRTRTAFLMYAVRGRTWVAMGDPVGPPAEAEELIALFLERCHDFGGTPVFYQLLPDRLHRYVDAGLVSSKLGEEAIVDLATLSFAGGRGKRFRQALRRLDAAGGTFDVVPASEVGALIGDLAEVSQAWLQAKRGGEKGFSLGFFDEAYLSRFPVAVIRRAGRIEAFANVWPGGDGVELSVDLMRYRPDAPENIMETLLVHLMKWGQDQGFLRFALGMAPLSGLPASPSASWWTRLGRFVYRHGGSVYNFRGLRAFKEKFSPDWQPRYLAYPGGAALPRILTDVAALVSGGYRSLSRRA
jgi:phosphatidylglycerol lysyltransferase